MLTGQEPPDAGTITFGDSVQLSYVDQSRDTLDPKKTVWEEISDGLDVIKLGDAEMNSRAYAAPSTSRAPTSRRRSASSPAASATASTSPNSSAPAATSSSSTSPPTTSTSRPCARWKTPSPTSPAAPW